MMNKLLTEWRKFLKEDEAVDLSEPPTSGRTTTNRSDSPLNIPKKEINFYSSDTNEQRKEILTAADHLKIKINPDEIINHARQALDKAFLNLEESTLGPKNEARIKNFAKSRNISSDKLIEEIKKIIQNIKKRVFFLFGRDQQILHFAQSIAKKIIPNEIYSKLEEYVIEQAQMPRWLNKRMPGFTTGRYGAFDGRVIIEMTFLLFKVPNLSEIIFHEIIHAYDFEIEEKFKKINDIQNINATFGEEQGLNDQLESILKKTGGDFYYHSNHELYIGIKKLQRLFDKSGLTSPNEFKIWLNKLMDDMKKEENEYTKKNPGPYNFTVDHSQPDIYRLLFIQLDKKNPKFYEVLWNSVTRIAKANLKPETGIAQ